MNLGVPDGQIVLAAEQTLYMVFVSLAIGTAIAMVLAVLLVLTGPNGIMPHRWPYHIINTVVNIVRSIPFIILLMAIIPFTRLLVGTIIGNNAAIVPLVVSAAPFVARMVEQSLEEIDVGVIEAARCMGATNYQIITKVLLVESIPGIIRGLSITTITLIGYGAMAGAVGAGGLGKIGYSYGFQRFNPTVMYMTVVLLVILVCIIQGIFNFTAAKVDKRNR